MRPLFALPCAALLAAPAAGAQELSYGIKFGGGMALAGGIDAQQSRGALTFAIAGDMRFPLLGPMDEVFAEFAYRYWKADWAEMTRFTDKPGGYGGLNFWTGVGHTPNGTGYIFNQDPASIARGAVDMRKNALEGWGFSFGYRYNLPGTGFYFQGALTLSHMIYYNEALGELRVYDRIPTVPAADAGTPVLLHREGLNYTPAANSMSPGLYVGARWRLDRNFFTEANLCWTSYSTAEYQPFVYTGQAAHVTEGTDSKLTLEFCIGLRF